MNSESFSWTNAPAVSKKHLNIDFPERPDLGEDIPAYGSWVGTRWFNIPSNPNHSMTETQHSDLLVSLLLTHKNIHSRKDIFVDFVYSI